MTMKVATSLQGVLLLFVFAVTIRGGMSLKCWTCSSDLSPECANPLNQTEHYRQFHTKDCEVTLSQHPYAYEKTICKKVVQRVHGDRVVIRSCSIPNPEEREIVDGACSPVTSASYITIESCHLCSTDLCNGATKAFTGGNLLIAISAATLLVALTTPTYFSAPLSF